MILRKPYAFLIKRFRLIHIVMSFMMVYLAYKTGEAVKYFNDYISSDVILKSQASNYFNTIMFVIVILIVAFSAVVYYLLRYKKKPRMTYLVTIVGYLFSLVIFYNSFSVFKELETTILEAKTIRLWRDLLTFCLYYQYIMTVIMLMRGLGFDIKKFNFQTDIKELEIESLDNEEFEFVLGDTSAKLARNSRKQIRRLRYFIVENKFILSIILGVVVSIFVILLVINLTITNKIYNENQNFLTNNYQINITNSYYTKVDSKGKYITSKNDNYLVLNMKIKSLSGEDKLTLTDFRIIIDDNKYYPITKYCDSLKDIGKCYNKQKITSVSDTYLLVYKLPKYYNKLMLFYEDSIKFSNAGIESKYKKVRLNPVNLDKISTVNETVLNSPLTINNNFVSDTSFSVISYDINKRFFHTYESCVNNKCVTLTDVIVTNNVTTTNKTIIKLKVAYNGSLSLNTFIDRYIFIEYKKGDAIYKSNVINRTPSNENQYIFLEIDSDILDADYISVGVGVRNYLYKYKLK